jgi:hypothetical protein
MDWIQLLVPLVLDGVHLVVNLLVTGIVVFLVQLYFQEQTKKRLIEFETRFSELHQEQAEVIAKLHEMLVEMQSDLRSAALTVSPDAEGWTEEEIQRRVDAAKRIH